jgi:hypothetical protein
MVKIVNGTIVNEGDIPRGAVVAEGIPEDQENGSVFSRSIDLCGRPVSYGYLGIGLLIAFIINGVGGIFFGAVAIGGAYLYGQRGTGGGASSSGMNRMPTRSGGANIKGIGDLPKPVNR